MMRRRAEKKKKKKKKKNGRREREGDSTASLNRPVKMLATLADWVEENFNTLVPYRTMLATTL